MFVCLLLIHFVWLLL